MMMEITRRRPNGPISPIRELFETFTNDSFFRPLTNFATIENTLALDIEEHGDDVVVTASLPGFTKDDVEIEIHEGVLSITARREEETEERERNFYRRERHTGTASRRVALPGIISDEAAAAELKDGVLTVRIPKAEEARPKRITVN